MGLSLLFVCGKLQPSSPAVVALHMTVFGNGQEALVNTQLVFYTMGLLLEAHAGMYVKLLMQREF